MTNKVLVKAAQLIDEGKVDFACFAIRCAEEGKENYREVEGWSSALRTKFEDLFEVGHRYENDAFPLDGIPKDAARNIRVLALLFAAEVL